MIPRNENGMMRTRGFTAVELMVVLGVVAILMLMALPTYQEKLVRDQLLEALPLADIAKPPVQTQWSASQTFPVNNAAAGLPSADKIVNNYISSVAVEQGAIQITFGNRAASIIAGKVLTLRPAVVQDAPIVPITWVCGYASEPPKMTAKGENKTNVPPIYLPMRCRAVGLS
jgi:type IV pilus assembly protein PilA